MVCCMSQCLVCLWHNGDNILNEQSAMADGSLVCEILRAIYSSPKTTVRYAEGVAVGITTIYP